MESTATQFEDGTTDGWGTVGTASLSLENGQLKVVTGAAWSGAGKVFETVPGKRYFVKSSTPTSISMTTYMDDVATNQRLATKVHHVGYDQPSAFTATGTQSRVSFVNNVATTFYLDNLVVEEAAEQSTLYEESFATIGTTGWTQTGTGSVTNTTGATLDAVLSAGTSPLMSKTFATVPDQYYVMTFDINLNGAAYLESWISNGSANIVHNVHANYMPQHQSLAFKATSATTSIAFLYPTWATPTPVNYTIKFDNFDLVAVDNNPETRYSANVLSYTDYYAFGMQLPGRHEKTPEYRYGFQGQEKDDELKGEGNSINFEYRMHDPRVGRFFAVDPLSGKYPWNSPYAFSENRVIDCIELEGLEIYYAPDATRLGQFGNSTEVRVVDANNVESFKTELAAAQHHRAEYNRIRTNLANNAYSSGVENAKKVMNDHGTAAWKFKNRAINELSTSTGMTEDELNVRVFLGIIKQTEAGMKNPPLEYNDHNRGDNFTEKSFEESPQDYAKHPGDNPNQPGLGTAAGAYQFTEGTYGRIGITSFSPESQDRAAVIWIGKVGFLDQVKEGNFQSFVFTEKFKGQWDSFNYINNETLNKLVEINKKLELKGGSKLAIKPGETLK